MSCSRTRMVQPPSFPPQSQGLVSLLPRASEGLSPQIRVCDLLASQDDPDGGEKGELGAPKGPLCSRRHSGMFPRLQPRSWLLLQNALLSLAHFPSPPCCLDPGPKDWSGPMVRWRRGGASPSLAIHRRRRGTRTLHIFPSQASILILQGSLLASETHLASNTEGCR